MFDLLHEQAAKLRTSIELTWQPRTGLYHYRDRATGLSLSGKVLVKQQGSGRRLPEDEVRAAHPLVDRSANPKSRRETT